MTKKKTGFTLEQHDKLGLEIQTIHDRLLAIAVELSNNYPKSKGEKAVGYINKIHSIFMTFKAELNELAHKEHGYNKGVDIEKLYNRGLRDDHIKYPQPIRPFPQEQK